MKQTHMLVSYIFCAAVIILAGPAKAHEFIVKPQVAAEYHVGQKVPFKVASSHIFMKSEELENPENVEVLFGGKSVNLDTNQTDLTYDGSIVLDKSGTAIIRGHRKGEVWSRTTQGLKKGDRSSLQGVIDSRNYEKFCKTLLSVGGDSAGYNQKVGDTLEIVPLSDPFKIKVGQDLPVQVLYNGKPVGVPVTATYDGFTETPNTYAYWTEPYGDDNICKIKLTRPGLWMIRAEHATDVKGPNFEKHIMRVVLVFEVK